ncbi:MAG: hypothetical protein SFV54_22680 [Bryobacteraceae bacterium]|nr:hypothetical protein [Bryobacteraceae bacterium]
MPVCYRRLSTFAAAALLVPVAAANERFAAVDTILADLSKITGLAVKRKVPADMMTRDRLKLYLEDRIRESVKPEEIRAEELTLKRFGFLPPEFDLKSATVELLTEQAAAFYDFRKRRLFLLEHTSGWMQDSALIHELAHALADQHFRLEKFIEAGGKSDDGATARMAVMEGQASWLMAEYTARKAGGSLQDSPAVLEALTNANLSGSEFPVFSKAPLYLRETLLFPYTRGTAFQHAVFLKLGQPGFAEVFRRPPATTQQVLHPELYLERREPSNPELPPAPGDGWRELSAGTVGELDHAILLKQYVGDAEAARLAPLWRGGRYRVLEDKSGNGATALLYVSAWDTAAAAGEYFALYRRVLAGKWKTLTAEETTSGVFAGHGSGGDFRVEWNGTQVKAVEGVKTIK